MSELDTLNVEHRLQEIPGWEYRGGKLYREFRFQDFAHAFDWMKRVAEEAERLNHHPEWTNVYDRVRVELVTHDASSVTDRDFALAKAMNRLADSRPIDPTAAS